MDGSTWYPLQYVNMATNPFTTAYTALTSYIATNTTGTITVTGNVAASGTATAYSTTTQPYLYFRMIITAIYPSNDGLVCLSELYLNFQNSLSYSSNFGATWSNTAGTVSNEIVSLSPSGQYALSTNSVTPLARLTLDNTNLDAQGSLTPATGAGTVTYSSSIVKVGTHSAFFNNTAGGSPSVYLNYTLPTILQQPPLLTQSGWFYPTALPASTTATPFGLNNGSTNNGSTCYISPSGAIGFTVNTTGAPPGVGISSSASVISINTWYHIAIVFYGTTAILYLNGSQLLSLQYTGLQCLANQGSLVPTNFFIGSMTTNYSPFAGYIDDVRIYTSALNAHEVASLYNNPPLTQTIATSSSYLPITSYVKPVLPNINAPIVDARVSQTGQYMVAVTSGTTNNVYYSTDFGVTFNALTLGSTAMTSCAISYDGSYFTVTNATTTYTLNRNSTGFTIALGNQAGQTNQANNAIAIGNLAGQTNQSANSIVLNASGTAVNATASGLYVAPISGPSGLSMNLLGYGEDKQVTTTGVSVLPGGIMDLSGPAPVINLYGMSTNQIYVPRVDTYNPTGENNLMIRSWWGIGFKSYDNAVRIAMDTRSGGAYFGGNVGIGTTNPIKPLHVYGNFMASPSLGSAVSYFQTSPMSYGGSYGFYGVASGTLVYNSTNANWEIPSDGASRGGGAIGHNWYGETFFFNVFLGGGTGTLTDAQMLTYRTMQFSSNGTIYFNRYTTNGTLTTINSNGQISVSSDRRIKNSITYLTDTSQALSSVMALKPATYKMNSGDGTHLGFIAQDVEEVIPLAVDGKKYEWQWESDEKGKPKFDDDGNIVYKVDGDGNRIIRPRGISDRAIIATQTLAIQEQQAQIVSLQTSLSSLESTFQSTLQATQSELATTQSQLTSLLAWAQAQGYSSS